MHPETLRYYERRGLLREPPRSPGGHRLYPSSTVDLLRLIKNLQLLGFTLHEVTDLVRTHLSTEDVHDPDLLRERAERKLAEIERRIAESELSATHCVRPWRVSATT